MDIQVRPMEPRDVDRAAAIYIAAWDLSTQDLLPPEIRALRTYEFRRDWWKQRLADTYVDQEFLMVADRASFVVGVGVAQLSDTPGVGELHSMYVDPAEFRNGIGSSLLAAASDWFGKNQCTRAVLSMFAGNKYAANFYAKNGWRPTGHHQLEDIWQTDAQLDCVEYEIDISTSA